MPYDFSQIFPPNNCFLRLSEEGNIALTDVVIGCEHDNKGPRDEQVSDMELAQQQLLCHIEPMENYRIFGSIMDPVTLNATQPNLPD